MKSEDMVRDFLLMLRPPRRQTVSEWADANRVLVSESSSAPGHWRTDAAPYQREVMDSFTDRSVERIVLKWGSQVGKTEIMLNSMFYAMEADPGPIAYVNATTLFSEDFSKRRFTPAARACPCISTLLGEGKSRDSAGTIGLKTFPGGSVAFIGASSPVELAGRPIRYIFGDEIDRWPLSAGSEGDPVGLIERRAETFRNRKLVLVSTPTTRDSRIEKEFLLGTQEHLEFCCPGCGEWHALEFRDIRYDYVETQLTDGRQFKIRRIEWCCPDCGALYPERAVKHAPQRWRARAPEALRERRTRSFHMNAFLSPWARWHDLVREYLEAGVDPERLKVFYNTRMGEIWDASLHESSTLPGELFARREDYPAEIPDDALILTLGADVQDARVEYEVVGWGEAEESWGIQRGVILGRPDAPDVWDALQELMLRRFLRADGRAMTVRVGFIDSGGHYTQEVYRRTRAFQKKGIKLFPIKGVTGDDRQYVEMSRSRRIGGILFNIAVDSGKNAIMYNATIGEAGPGYMHFPKDEQCGYSQEFFYSLISERLGPYINRSGRRVMGWHKVYDHNEALDCRNYARAAFKGFDWPFQALRQKYDRPAPSQGEGARRQASVLRAGTRVISRGVKI